MPIQRIRNLFRDRKCHVYCVGAAKTGTTSISHVYSQCMRAAHEPEVTQTTNLVVEFLQNNISESTVRKELQQRDKRLFLELESSHPLGYLAPFLTDIYPEARFVVTVREPKSWLKSRLNYHHYKSPPEWKKYRDYIWSRHFNGFAKEEKILEEHGLFSLEAYLKQYAEQYEILFSKIPSDKYIIIKTSEIDEKIPAITKFIGIGDKNLSPVWTNKLEKEKDILSLLESDFVSEKISQHCAFYKNIFE